MDQFQSQNSLDSNQITPVSTTNVWIVTLPFFSHVVCASRLAEQIAGYGVSVTLLVAKDDIQRLRKFAGQTVENWKQQGLDIDFRTLGIQATNLADSVGGPVRILSRILQVEKAFEAILKKELERKSGPSYVILDSMAPRVLDIALQHNIPACPLITFSGSCAVANIYTNRLESKNILNIPDLFHGNDSDKKLLQEVISLPGLPLMRMCDLNAINFKSHPMYELGCRRHESLQKADVLLLSGFRELEPRAYDEWERMSKIDADANGIKMPHIWPIGPLFRMPSIQDTCGIQTGDEERNPCIKFLDSQSPSSVVYVAFGTDVNLSQEQIEELVYGLESCQHPFLCVLHPPVGASQSDAQVEDLLSIIPPDCLSRIGNRGMFVKWAPQIKVLCHPSTGAFMSHCGYNSQLETVAFGVPILAWPWQYEQFMNCRHLVDEAKIAVEVCPGLLPDGFVHRKDVEKSVTTLFHSDEGAALRKRALQMKQRAQESVGLNGSSKKNMQGLVALINSISGKTEP